MKILKTSVTDGLGTFPIDTIEDENGLWLVPIWTEEPNSKQRMPGRLIRLDVLDYQKLGPPHWFDFALSLPVPKGVLDGTIRPEQARGYTVIDSPFLIRPMADGH